MHPFFKKRRRIEEEATVESDPAVVNSEASTSFVLSTPEIPTEPENCHGPMSGPMKCGMKRESFTLGLTPVMEKLDVDIVPALKILAH
ncbi:hypothetical protein JTE90_027443 [Oedothorax gibbosus]|uniref:Uncharacterized protein n=1 Tax=Oedothorax gibbosus TaxID=931172 RepID=A0AAV6VZV9_9ARAC|nr:hypothetical protein JTE90_027443 [Oedothorax gibbosus]